MVLLAMGSEGRPMGGLRLSFLGYSLLEVWAACVIFNQNSVAESVTALSSGVGLSYGLHMLFSNFSAIAVTLATLALVLLCRKRDRIANRGKVTIAATAVNIVGTALILSGHPWAGFAGLIIAGLGNAWLWICWGDVYAALETESAELVAMGSVLVQAVLLVAMFAVPQVVQAVFLLLLVPCSSAMYLVALKKTEPSSATPLMQNAGSAMGNTGKATAQPRFGGGFAVKLVLGLGAPITFAYFLLGCGFSIPGLQEGIELVFALGLLAFALVFLGFLRFTPSFDLPSICCVQLALLVGACLAALAGWQATVGCALVLATTFCSQYFILLYCARLCREGFGNVVFTFGVGQLINHGCGFLGTFTAGMLFAFPSLASADFTAAKGCVLCALAFFVAAAVQGRRRQSAEASEPATVDEAQVREALLELAREKHLSARETEVFLLLAKGRSAPFIRDELMVSLNTVSSHVKHIYGKLGIHSRQELIDLVDAASR